MRIWLWDLPGFCGVTDDEHYAMARAQECMRNGDIARVELAVLASAYRRLSSDHIRIGTGWIGVQVAGIVDWIPFATGAEPDNVHVHTHHDPSLQGMKGTAMQQDTATECERTHLNRLKLAADVLLSEPDTISDALEAELCVLRDRLEQSLLSLPDESASTAGA